MSAAPSRARCSDRAGRAIRRGRPTDAGSRPVGLLEPEPLDDVIPGVVVGPADGSGKPWLLAPDLDRPIGNWVDTDLNGWFVDGRHGPFWLDDERIVATISDQGRSHPYVFRLDPKTGAGRGHRRLAEGDITTHTIAVARGGRIATLGTDGTRAMELRTLDVDGDDAGDATLQTRSRIGSRWQDAFDMPEMRLVQAPGAGGPIDVWIASPPGAGDAALPAVVNVHGGPMGAWAPAPHIEVILLVAHGYRVILPNIRGSATTAPTGSARSSATGAGSMPPMSMRPSITSSSSAWRTLTGSA